MQNKEITFLVFSTDYDYVQVGLVQHGIVRKEVKEHKFTASKNLMPVILALLAEFDLQWNNLTFLATNQGPGPFTTLRAIITTLNGLSFSTQLPLIGVDGLHALLQEAHTPQPTLALLNAFGQDVYYAYHTPTGITSGWMNIDTFLSHIQTVTTQPQIIIGNGGHVYKAAIQEVLTDATVLEQQAPTLQAIAHQALRQWHAGEVSELLLPLYLKTLMYKQST